MVNGVPCHQSALEGLRVSAKLVVMNRHLFLVPVPPVSRALWRMAKPRFLLCSSIPTLFFPFTAVSVGNASNLRRNELMETCYAQT